MTHSVNAPLPPPPATQSIDPPPAGTESPTGSTGDAAKHEAANVKDTAAQAGSQVAATAADQAREVAHETRRQAQDLLDQGRSQVREQAVTQQHKAAEGLSSLATEMRGLANGTSDGAPGPARDLLEQASGKVEEFSTWLQSREPADLVDEVRSFARRKPGLFLLGAAAAGVLAGRVTRGLKDAGNGPAERNIGGRVAGSSDVSPNQVDPNRVDPAPAYGGYTGITPPAGAPTTATTTSTPLPPPPYGTVPPAGTTVPPTTPSGWDDPARRPGEVR
jgi:hypothetical protein